MTSKISIEEINELEVKRILKDTKFSRLKPVVCSRCGKKKASIEDCIRGANEKAGQKFRWARLIYSNDSK